MSGLAAGHEVAGLTMAAGSKFAFQPKRKAQHPCARISHCQVLAKPLPSLCQVADTEASNMSHLIAEALASSQCQTSDKLPNNKLTRHCTPPISVASFCTIEIRMNLSHVPHFFPTFCSGMESLGEIQRRLIVLEQRHADLRRVVHLLATHHTSPPDPAHVPLPSFKPANKTVTPAAHTRAAPAFALFFGSVLHL